MPGFNYLACGNSTNKKDAQKNSTKDFLQFLVREGKLNQNDIPVSIENNNFTVIYIVEFLMYERCFSQTKLPASIKVNRLITF